MQRLLAAYQAFITNAADYWFASKFREKENVHTLQRAEIARELHISSLPPNACKDVEKRGMKYGLFHTILIEVYKCEPPYKLRAAYCICERRISHITKKRKKKALGNLRGRCLRIQRAEKAYSGTTAISVYTEIDAVISVCMYYCSVYFASISPGFRAQITKL